MREQQSLDKHLLNDFNSMTVFAGDKILTILVRIEMKRYVYFFYLFCIPVAQNIHWVLLFEHR